MGDLLPRAESRGLIGHLRSRAFVLIAFLEWDSWWLSTCRQSYRDTSGSGLQAAEVIILHPMEAVLLRLRIGFQLGVIISGICVICDISWNGKKIFAKAKRSDRNRVELGFL